MSKWDSSYEEGQTVIITGDQTGHGLAINSQQVIDHIDYATGLPALVVIDRFCENPLRYLVEEDVKPLDTMKA